MGYSVKGGFYCATEHENVGLRIVSAPNVERVPQGQSGLFRRRDGSGCMVQSGPLRGVQRGEAPWGPSLSNGRNKFLTELSVVIGATLAVFTKKMLK